MLNFPILDLVNFSSVGEDFVPDRSISHYCTFETGQDSSFQTIGVLQIIHF